MPLSDLTLETLAEWSAQARAQAQGGHLPQRIRPLASVDPNGFAIAVSSLAAPNLSLGHQTQPIAVMSVIKPFLLLYALTQFETAAVFDWVGTSPSDQPFNSLTQLQLDGGMPRNPMINSGAITLCDRLPGATGQARCEQFQAWLNAQATTTFKLDPILLQAVQAIGQEQNQRLTEALAKYGRLESDPAVTLDTYQRVCCLTGTIADFAQLGRLLIAPPAAPTAHPRATIRAEHSAMTTVLMLTCGLYEASPQWAVEVGVPAKSGVSGLVLAVVPQQGAIAIYSPRLDAVGNSVVGLILLRQLARSLGLHVFQPGGSLHRVGQIESAE